MDLSQKTVTRAVYII